MKGALDLSSEKGHCPLRGVCFDQSTEEFCLDLSYQSDLLLRVTLATCIAALLSFIMQFCIKKRKRPLRMCELDKPMLFGSVQCEGVWVGPVHQELPLCYRKQLKVALATRMENQADVLQYMGITSLLGGQVLAYDDLSSAIDKVTVADVTEVSVAMDTSLLKMIMALTVMDNTKIDCLRSKL